MSGIVCRIIYTLVGMAGIWGITLLFRRDYARHEHEGAETDRP
jgi:uncharacterized membrane protein YuzA (DUF378 family)